MESKVQDRHDRFIGFAGEFAITLKSISPIIICSGREQGVPLRGMREGKEFYFIPGTSIKGMLRNIYEIIDGGCLRLTQGSNLRTPQEREYGGCERFNYLCPACRVFGMLSKGEVYRGKVNPGDLIGPLAGCIRGEEKLDVTVGCPKAKHAAFYRKEGKLRGRKGYYHQEKPVKGVLQTKSVYPLPAGTTFHGTIGFKNLNLKELTLLYYCLILEQGLAHKLGFGKSAGLGSIILEITSMRLADLGKRQNFLIDWLSGLPQESRSILDDLKKRTDPTYLAFKKIYSIQDIQGKHYGYPSYEWFQKTPQMSLDEFNNGLGVK